MDVTVAGIVTEASADELRNALTPIAVTPLGIGANPVQSSSSMTTLSVIVKLPEPVTDPTVTQSMTPS
jgi:hypothetical protein